MHLWYRLQNPLICDSLLPSQRISIKVVFYNFSVRNILLQIYSKNAIKCLYWWWQDIMHDNTRYNFYSYIHIFIYMHHKICFLMKIYPSCYIFVAIYLCNILYFFCGKKISRLELRKVGNIFFSYLRDMF